MNTSSKSNLTGWTEVQQSYKILSQIGAGSYGTVIKAQCLATDELVAIKYMTNFCDQVYDCRKVLREI